VSLLAFCEWLAATENSTALRESLFMYPLVESSHVMFLLLFVGLTVMLDVRLLGIAMRNLAVSELVDRILPWVRAGFAVMVFTGVLLFYAIPVRTYQSVWFRAKVIMLILAAFNIWYFHYRVYPKRAEWDNDPRPPWVVRRAGLASIILWFSIIVAGRFIAYNWFDCDIQPQPAFVNWFAGCVIATD
jgi:uncharacterized membrane protein SirB2